MTQELTVQKNQVISFENVQKMATAVAKSGLFGVKNSDQALALLLLAQAEGLHPMVAARDYDIIQNRPSKKSEAMLRSFIDSNGSVKWIQLTEKIAEAEFSHPKGGTVTISWTIEMATTAGLVGKIGSMYKKYPRQMLRARCVSEGVKTVCPSATGGMYTPEEIQDTNEEGATSSTKPKSLEEAVTAEDKPAVADNKIEDAEIREAEPEAAEPEAAESEEHQRYETSGKIVDLMEKSGETNDRKWTKYGCKINNSWYGTFSSTIYGQMIESKQHQSEVEIIFEKIKKDDNILYNILTFKERWEEENTGESEKEKGVSNDEIPI